MSNIYDRQIAAGRILALTPAWQRKERKALQDIAEMLNRCNPYVSLSWGKQSTCLMHMVYRVCPTVPGLFFREVETEIIANFAEVITAFRARWSIVYFEEMYYPFGIDGQSRDSHHKAARRWEQEHGYTGVFMGFVRSESKARRYTMAKADKHNIFRYTDGFLRSTPLRFWTDEDIAAYIAKYDIPMLNLYHRFGLQTRTSAGLTPGTHAEIGFDQMTQEQKDRIMEVKRGSNQTPTRDF